MNNIGLIISGNLTGFSHFFASPKANEMCREAKFDFDCRNYVTFLDKDRKVYVISFAPNVIAVSLVTRILDSFRRPGILVVSLLLPRRCKVKYDHFSFEESLYRLLNDINERFYQKNFLNGMLNQSLNVLMQDYYEEFLSRTETVQDLRQRSVNASIEQSLINKRMGYVRSGENDIYLYLSSLCRKSYEGYHQIFIGEDVPQNMDEPPVEVVLYSVLVTNNNQRLHNIKLSDMIYKLSPQKGEKEMNTDYTYQQVLQGAASRISAIMDGELIRITYRFEEESKEVTFSFVNGKGEPVALFAVAPVVEFLETKTRCNINCEVWRFVGKEIFQRAKLQCREGSNYSIKTGYDILDIPRLTDGAKFTIPVEELSSVKAEFLAPFHKPKTIIFKRHSDGKEFRFSDVQGRLNESLPGNLDEYSYEILSDYYRPVSGELTSDGNLNPKLVSILYQPTVNPLDSTRDRGTGLQLQSNTFRGDYEEVPVRRKNIVNKKIILGVSALAIVLFCIFGPNIPWGADQGGGEKKKEDTGGKVAENDSITKSIFVMFSDLDGDSLYYKTVTNYQIIGSSIKVEVSPNENVASIDTCTSGLYYLKYKVTGSAQSMKDISFSFFVGPDDNKVCVADDKKYLADYLKDKCRNSDTIFVRLNIRYSAIKLYNELYSVKKSDKPIDENQKIAKEQKIYEVMDGSDNENFAVLLSGTLANINITVKKASQQSRDDQIPNGMMNFIKKGKKIPQSMLKGKDKSSSSATEYNTWIVNVYQNKKTPEQQEIIKEELQECKTWSDVGIIINRYRGNQK